MATSYPDRTNARGIWKLSDITKNIKTKGTFPRGGPSGQTGLLGGGADAGANNTSIEKITISTTGNSQAFGDLPKRVYGPAACSNTAG